MFVETELALATTIERAWSAIVGLEDYPRWNPFVVRAEGRLEVGAPLRLRVRWEAGWEMSVGEWITRVEPPGEGDGERVAVFAYRYGGLLHEAGLVRSSRTQTLRQRPGEACVYHTREVWEGSLARFCPREAVRRGFERQAVALREWVEGDPGRSGALG